MQTATPAKPKTPFGNLLFGSGMKSKNLPFEANQSPSPLKDSPDIGKSRKEPERRNIELSSNNLGDELEQLKQKKKERLSQLMDGTVKAKPTQSMRPQEDDEDEELEKLKAKLRESRNREDLLKSSRRDDTPQRAKKDLIAGVDPNSVVEWSGRAKGNYDPNDQRFDSQSEENNRNSSNKRPNLKLQPVDANSSRLVKNTKPKRKYEEDDEDSDDYRRRKQLEKRAKDAALLEAELKASELEFEKKRRERQRARELLEEEGRDLDKELERKRKQREREREALAEAAEDEDLQLIRQHKKRSEQAKTPEEEEEAERKNQKEAEALKKKRQQERKELELKELEAELEADERRRELKAERKRLKEKQDRDDEERERLVQDSRRSRQNVQNIEKEEVMEMKRINASSIDQSEDAVYYRKEAKRVTDESQISNTSKNRNEYETFQDKHRGSNNMFRVEDSTEFKENKTRDVLVEEAYLKQSKNSSMKPIESSSMERQSVYENAEFKRLAPPDKRIQSEIVARSTMPIEGLNEEEYVEQYRIQKAEETNEDKDSFIIIPLLTFPKIKSLKKKTAVVKSDNENILEQMKDKENLEDLLDLSGTIIEDLKTYNKNNDFVKKLGKDHEYLKRNIGEMNERDKAEFMDKFREYLEDLNKLDVKQRPFIDSNDEKVLKEMEKKEEIKQMFKSQMPQEQMNQINNSQEVSKPRERQKAKASIIKFLIDYKNRIRKMNSPSSEYLASEVEEAIAKINAIEVERTDKEGIETLKLLAYSMNKHFGDGEKEVPEVDDKTIKEELKVLAFNDLLRALNKLSDVKFMELDEMITDHFNTRNLLDLRHSLISENKYDSSHEKMNDILRVNSLTDDKARIENLLVSLGKELLPPRAYTNMTKMEDSDAGLNICFVDLKKKPQIAEIKKPMSDPLVSKKESNDKKDISFNFDRKFKQIEPNVIDSDQEVEPDYRDELIEKLESLIDRVREEKDKLNDVKEQVKEMSKETLVTDEDKIPMLIQLSQALEIYAEFELASREFQGPYQDAFTGQSEAKYSSRDDDPKNKGIVKLYPKFIQELAKLKVANQNLIKEMNKSRHMKAENNSDRGPEIELLNKELIGANKVLESMEIIKLEDANGKFLPKEDEIKAEELDNRIERIAKYIKQFQEKGEKIESQKDTPREDRKPWEADESFEGEENEKMSKIQKGLLKLTRQLLKAMEEAKRLNQNLNNPDCKMSPLEAKNEVEQKQYDYEFSRNNFKNELGKTLIKLMLAQKTGLLPMSSEIKEHFNNIFDIIEEKKDRETVTQKILEFYVKLREAKFLEEDVEKIEIQHKIEAQELKPDEQLLHSQRSKEDPGLGSKADVAEIPKTIPELKEEIKETLYLLRKKADVLEDPVEKVIIEQKIEEIARKMDEQELPSVECYTEVKDLAIKLQEKQEAIEPLDPKTALGRRQSMALDQMRNTLQCLNLNTDNLMELVLRDLSAKTDKAAQELDKKGLEKRVNLKETTTVLAGKKEGAPEEAKEDRYGHLTELDKKEIEDKMTGLKMNITNSIEYAEEGIYYKVEDVQASVENRLKKEPNNKYLLRISEKLAEVRQALNNSDRNKNNNVENLLKDILNAKAKEDEQLKKKMSTIPDEQKETLKEESEKFEKLAQLGNTYGGLKGSIKSMYLNMLKNAEEAVKTQKPSKDEQINNAKEIDFGEDSFLNKSLYNSEEDLRRKRKLKDRSFKLDNFEDDENSVFSYKQFSENSSVLNLIDDFDQKNKKDKDNKRRVSKKTPEEDIYHHEELSDQHDEEEMIRSMIKRVEPNEEDRYKKKAAGPDQQLIEDEKRRQKELEKLIAELERQKALQKEELDAQKDSEESEEEELRRLQELRRLKKISPEELERLRQLERKELEGLRRLRRLGKISPEDLERLEKMEAAEMARLQELRRLKVISPEDLEFLETLEQEEMVRLEGLLRRGLISPDELERLHELMAAEQRRLTELKRLSLITPSQLERLEALDRYFEALQRKNQVHEPIKLPGHLELTAKLEGFSLKRKRFFKEALQSVEGVDIPVIVPVEEYIRRKYRSDTPESQKSHQDHCDPEIDPCESFYEEVEPQNLLRGNKSMDKQPIYRRKIRKLNPQEIDKREKEKLFEEEMLKKKNIVLSERLEKVDEWSKGKRILKKKKDFVKVKKQVENYDETPIDFLKVIGKDPETRGPVFVKDEGTQRTKQLEPEEEEEIRNKPAAYTILKGSNNTYKILKLLDPEDNILVKMIGCDLENPSIRLYEKYPELVNGLPLFEEDKNRFLDRNAPECSKNEKLENIIKVIEAKPYLEAGDLTKFLTELKNSPQVSVEFHQEEPEELNQKHVTLEVPAEAVIAANENALFKVIDELIKSKQIDPYGNRKKRNLVSRKLDQMMDDKSIYVAEPEGGSEVSRMVREADEEQPDDNPIDELKKALENTKNVGDLQGVYQELAARVVRENEEVGKQNEMLDELFKEYKEALRKRNETFKDFLFARNSSSMVNNSIKSKEDYKHIGWKKLSEIYEVRTV